MIRRILDMALVESFVDGVARSSALRLALYGADRRLIHLAPRTSPASAFVDTVLPELPEGLGFDAIESDGLPARLARLDHNGFAMLVSPIYLPDAVAGYLAMIELRSDAGPPSLASDAASASAWGAWQDTYASLPHADDAERRATLIWAGRVLAAWTREGLQRESAGAHLALLGDIGAMLAGEETLSAMLQRLVAQTAHVMECSSCSIRLYDQRTDRLSIAAAYNLAAEYFSLGMILRSETPIDDLALRGELIFIADAQRDERILFREEAAKLGIVSGLTTGLFYRGRPLGVIRVYADRQRRFSSAARDLLMAVADQAAVAIANAQLLEERLRTERLERQLQLAGDIQSRMMRTTQPAHDRIQSAIVFEPSSHVSGDFCDLLELADGRLAAAVGDVVGHGVAASLLMASIRGALRATARSCSSLSEIMTRLNKHICRETRPSEFATILLVCVDHEARRLTYCSAGHEPILILRNHELLQTDDGEMIAGSFPDIVYYEHHLAIEPHDLILLYTDGVVEAMNFDGETFGRDRLRASLELHGNANIEATLANIRWDVRRFVGLADQSDDLTMVGLTIVG